MTAALAEIGRAVAVVGAIVAFVTAMFCLWAAADRAWFSGRERLFSLALACVFAAAAVALFWSRGS